MPGKSGQNGSKVIYSVGVTLNIGNYESVRMQVGLERSCLEEDEDKVFEKVFNKVEKLAKKKIEQFRKLGYE